MNAKNILSITVSVVLLAGCASHGTFSKQETVLEPLILEESLTEEARYQAVMDNPEKYAELMRKAEAITNV
ncbi:hypothetical protein ACMXYX_18075 (plasmid) [Neptuniibacter sp. QD72_48]|uniref:hypothetical protein n=1 Tax=Neptuniibacter sp. QD72_48 TaxID=3398214 RepID=UPI0039F5AC5F